LINKIGNHFVETGYLPVVGLSLTPSPLTVHSQPSTGLPSGPTGTMLWLHIICCTGQHTLTASGCRHYQRVQMKLWSYPCVCAIWLDLKADVTVETRSGWTG